MAYVIGNDGVPLMPCSNAIARLLIRQGKAKVKNITPFTIKLLYHTDTIYTQPLTLGVDTSSGTIGVAVVSDIGDVVYLSEVEVRNDIVNMMEKRSSYRRNRRNRKTRYRKPRWLNRKNSIKKDRFSPTMKSKINSHLKEINFVKSILPISKIILETASFDTHALKNPEVLKNKWMYQRGINYGLANTKAYVLSRDGYICQNCNGKSKDKRLEIHHIVFRSAGGSDDEKNLVTLCGTCHYKLHNGDISLKYTGKRKSQLKYATQMSSIRLQLLKSLPEAEETFGFVTKEHRQSLELKKEHHMDAVAIASQGTNVQFKVKSVLFKKCIPKGDYQQTRGIRSEQKRPTGKICGFRRLDKVRYLGSFYFVRARMSTGYAILIDINGKKVDFKPMPKFSKMQRVGARKSLMIMEGTINI